MCQDYGTEIAGVPFIISGCHQHGWNGIGAIELPCGGRLTMSAKGADPREVAAKLVQSVGKANELSTHVGAVPEAASLLLGIGQDGQPLPAPSPNVLAYAPGLLSQLRAGSPMALASRANALFSAASSGDRQAAADYAQLVRAAIGDGVNLPRLQQSINTETRAQVGYQVGAIWDPFVDAVETLGKPFVYTASFMTGGAAGLGAAWIADEAGMLDALGSLIEKMGGILLDIISSVFFTGACAAVARLLNTPELGVGCTMISVGVEIAKSVARGDWGGVGHALMRIAQWASGVFNVSDAINGALEGALQVLGEIGDLSLVRGFLTDGLRAIEQAVEGLPPATALAIKQNLDRIRQKIPEVEAKIRALPRAGAQLALDKIGTVKVTDASKIPHGPVTEMVGKANEATRQRANNPILGGIVQSDRGIFASGPKLEALEIVSGRKAPPIWIMPPSKQFPTGVPNPQFMTWYANATRIFGQMSQEYLAHVLATGKAPGSKPLDIKKVAPLAAGLAALIYFL